MPKPSKSELATMSQGVAYVAVQIEALSELSGTAQQDAVKALKSEGAPTNLQDLVSSASGLIIDNNLGWLKKNQFLGMIYGNLTTMGMSDHDAHTIKNRIDDLSRRLTKFYKN